MPSRKEARPISWVSSGLRSREDIPPLRRTAHNCFTGRLATGEFPTGAPQGEPGAAQETNARYKTIAL